MENIMVIDDSKPIRQQVTSYLEPLGFSVIDASNGNDALIKLEARPSIRLFIVDVNMPTINGMEFCSRLRNIPEYLETPVFMLTADTTPDLVKEAKSLGVKAWILKPFEPAPLQKALEVMGILKK